ncbi:MAG: hypothetical protein LBH21_02935 [Gracilibacteraceae bacterium]|jgi:hypothetical protein|nr:hypothetical protein [Gracilibacteraceae bacterium]
MSGLFSLYLRVAGRQWPLFVLLIVCQLALGEISSAALSEKKPELSLALAAESEGELARRYVLALEQIPELRLTKVSPLAAREEIFAAHDVQGLAVVTAAFDELVADGRGGAVVLYPAPGVSDVSMIREFLAVEALMLRAEIIRREESLAHGLSARPPAPPAVTEPILTVVYDGPAAAPQAFSAPPVVGAPALFLLFAFLQAAQTAPGPDNRRLALYGGRARARAGAAFALALWTCWLLLTALYICGLRLFFHIAVPPPTAAALFLLALYAAALGCLPALTGKRAWAVWLFIPWFLLNMTLGGGLWNLPLPSPLLIPLLPLGVIPALQSGGWVWLAPLAGQTAAAAALVLFLAGRPAPRK